MGLPTGYSKQRRIPQIRVASAAWRCLRSVATLSSLKALGSQMFCVALRPLYTPIPKKQSHYKHWPTAFGVQ